MGFPTGPDGRGNYLTVPSLAIHIRIRDYLNQDSEKNNQEQSRARTKQSRNLPEMSISRICQYAEPWIFSARTRRAMKPSIARLPSRQSLIFYSQLTLGLYRFVICVCFIYDLLYFVLSYCSTKTWKTFAACTDPLQRRRILRWLWQPVVAERAVELAVAQPQQDCQKSWWNATLLGTVWADVSQHLTCKWFEHPTSFTVSQTLEAVLSHNSCGQGPHWLCQSGSDSQVRKVQTKTLPFQWSPDLAVPCRLQSSLPSFFRQGNNCGARCACFKNQRVAITLQQEGLNMFELQEHQILPLHIRSGFLVAECGRVWQCNLRFTTSLRIFVCQEAKVLNWVQFKSCMRRTQWTSHLAQLFISAFHDLPTLFTISPRSLTCSTWAMLPSQQLESRKLQPTMLQSAI